MTKTGKALGQAVAVALTMLLLASGAFAAGPRTHAEMGARAWRLFLADLEPLLPGLNAFKDDPDAMRAFWCGCMFPDFAQDGINDDAAEFAHWYTFQCAHFDYIKTHYPPPWNKEARRHVAFFLGVLCHGVGDVPWHFDEWGHQAFMNDAWAHDGKTKEIEKAGEVFCHARYRLRPAMNGAYWWPKADMKAVFANTGKAVTTEQLDRGCKVLEAQWREGKVLAPLAYPYAVAAYRWTGRNLKDYYYGGLDNGGAYSAACIAHDYARLQDWGCYQNILMQASGFPPQQPYLPCQDTTLWESAPTNACGGEPLLELAGGHSGGRRSILLRFDVSDWPASKPIAQATMSLYLVARRGEKPGGEMEAALYQVNRPWNEGTVQSDPVQGSAGRASSGGDAGWVFTGNEGETWAVPGADGVPEDREADAVSVVTIGRKERSGHWVTWDVTALARFWSIHPARNCGVLLRAGDTGSCGAGSLVFYSSQAFRADPKSPRDGRCVAWHPMLVLRTK